MQTLRAIPLRAVGPTTAYDGRTRHTITTTGEQLPDDRRIYIVFLTSDNHVIAVVHPTNSCPPRSASWEVGRWYFPTRGAAAGWAAWLRYDAGWRDVAPRMRAVEPE